jgi:predicted nucleotidyltransferase
VEAPRTAEIASALGQVLDEAAPRGLLSAYLFGSHARGASHRESDLDVGILLSYELYPSPRNRFEEQVRLCAFLMAELATRLVDVVVLNDAPPRLGRAIVSTGRRVFCSQPEADHAFVRDVQLRAADLDPFLRRMQRLKLAALAR